MGFNLSDSNQYRRFYYILSPLLDKIIKSKKTERGVVYSVSYDLFKGWLEGIKKSAYYFGKKGKMTEITKKKSKKNICEFCGKKLDYVSFKCKFCGHRFCSEHRLPENHHCIGLEEYKKKKRESWDYMRSLEPKKTGVIILPINLFKSVKRMSRRVKIPWKWVLGILFVIGFVSYFFTEELPPEVRSKISDLKVRIFSLIESLKGRPPSVSKCIKEFREYIKELEIKSPIEFGYTIHKVKTFNSSEEAKDFVDEWSMSAVSSWDYRCRNLSNSIGILYEVKFSRPIFIGIEKGTDVFLCYENGTHIDTCPW